MKPQGFTLIELLIVLAIAAIVVTMGVPSFQETIAQNRLVTTLNSMTTLGNLARSESIKRGMPVTLCAGDQAGCAGDWKRGQVVFVDEDNDRVLDNDEEVVRVGEAFSPDIQVDAIAKAVTWTSQGWLAQATADLLQDDKPFLSMCSEKAKNNNIRAWNLQFTGSITYSKKTGDCSSS